MDLSIINFVTVAYSADEVIYVWQLPKKKAVDYEGKLQLSQFDIMETAFRGLNYSRGNNSKCINFALEKKNLFKMSFLCLFSGNLLRVASGDCITETYGVLSDPDLPPMYIAGGPILGGFLAE